MKAVTKVHNMSVSRAAVCDDTEQAISLVREWFEEQFERPLNQEEEDDLENQLEIINLDDAENHFGFAISELENFGFED